MKTKETKNFKKLEEVINHCMDKGDTLFAIFAPKNVSTGVGMFVGNEKAVANGLASMIYHSLEADADNNAKRLGNAFINLAKDLGFSMKDVTVEIKQKEKDKKRKSAKKDGKKQVKK